MEKFSERERSHSSYFPNRTGLLPRWSDHLTNKNDDKSTWAIGGGVIGGLGIGLLFHSYNPIAVPAFLMLGLGFGLMITSIFSRERRND